MKMQHTVYMEAKHKEILDELILNEKLGNGKQGTPNYNLAILKCIEATDSHREAQIDAMRRQLRLYQWLIDEERHGRAVETLRNTKPKLYKKILSLETKYDLIKLRRGN